MDRNSCSETRTHIGLTRPPSHPLDGSKLEEKLAPHGAKKALGLGVRKVKLQQKLEMYEPHPTR